MTLFSHPRGTDRKVTTRSRTSLTTALLIAMSLCAAAQQAPQLEVTPPAKNNPTDSYSIKATVRRVVVDVVVTDSQGIPQRGLTAKDFTVAEDGKPQQILSFDPHTDDGWKGVLPANVPANTFINLPRQPEQGPLYLLFYDMVNTGDASPIGADYGANIFARQQLIKFINGKTAGTRFALIVLSDGLHLVQGFTNDKQLLLNALDPEGHTPHMPKVLLNSANFGIGDPYYYIALMKDMAHYLDGFPGRKNIIWVSGKFPFAVFANQGDPVVIDTTRKELAELAANQIAIYPVGASGTHPDNLVLDEVADETGGHAFPGSNDLAADITKAADDGGTYYTLSYSSTNKNYDGKLRHIQLELAKQGYRLAYRREYFADPEVPDAAPPPGSVAAKMQAAGVKTPPDTLYAYIRHGAPISHDLLFSAHVVPVGPARLATAEQMADLSDEPAYFRKRHKNQPLQPLPPVPLQTYSIEFDIPSKQFRANPMTRDQDHDPIEFASAAYTADGLMLNGKIGNASPPRETTRYYPAQQDFEVPTSAAWLCLAVRDPVTGRIGNLELPLPIAPELPKSAVVP